MRQDAAAASPPQWESEKPSMRLSDSLLFSRRSVPERQNWPEGSPCPRLCCQVSPPSASDISAGASGANTPRKHPASTRSVLLEASSTLRQPRYPLQPLPTACWPCGGNSRDCSGGDSRDCSGAWQGMKTLLKGRAAVKYLNAKREEKQGVCTLNAASGGSRGGKGTSKNSTAARLPRAHQSPFQAASAHIHF